VLQAQNGKVKEGCAKFVREADGDLAQAPELETGQL
jgi:hypothetical protein